METKTNIFAKVIGTNRKLIVLGIFLLSLKGTSGEYKMENHCNEEFSFILEDEDQIKLGLTDNYIHETAVCETTFEAWYTRYEKFMFYFENLNLDCDEGHLEFHIGEEGYARVSGLESEVCGNIKPEGVFTVESRYFRIKYVPKRRQYVSNIFTMIITTYTDGYCPSYAHECENSRCINEELACNGYDSCGDGSGCNIGTGAIIGIVIGSLVGLALIISIVICCICCTRQTGRTPGTVQSRGVPAMSYTTSSQQNYTTPMYGSPYNTSQSQYPGTSPSVATTTTASQQGNNYPVHGFNQGTGGSTQFPVLSSNIQTSHQPAEEKQCSDPPPQYSELFGNSEQNNMQS